MMNSRKTWIAACMMTMLLAVAAQVHARSAAAAPRSTDLEKKMFEQVNSERAQRGLAPLAWNEKLVEAADAHLQVMIEAKNLSHQLPGEAPMRSRIAATELRFSTA